MRRGSILGYDLNEKNCQISYYDEKKDEPETMEVSVDRYQIPLMLGYVKGLSLIHIYMRSGLMQAEWNTITRWQLPMDRS